MMSKFPSVALIDYDMGNLRSVAKALEKVGCAVEWVREPSRLMQHDVMVLPGVGAFSVAVENLRKRKLFDSIRKWIEDQKPFLGICLGYQLLFESSEENERSGMKGLGFFEGKVRKLPHKKNIKIPHIGWNQIEKSSKFNILKGIPDGSYFYFDHSYIPVPKDNEIVATTTDYGIEFVSSVSKGNLFASQFHPEKSGEIGLKLLRSFIKLC